MPLIRGINVPKETNVKNYIINGDMSIAQRGTSFPTIASGTYTIDRYYYEKTGAMVHTVSQDADAPTLAQANYLFKNSLRANLTTPDTSITAGDYVAILQKIEGYNFSNIAQKSFTISFWVKATTAGIYCVSLRNSGADRSYVAEYTINTTNTWEYKTITVAAPPSAGTWNYTNGVGLHVGFVLAAGTTYQTTPGSWQTGNFFGTVNQVNGVNTGSTDFRITGVMINESVVAAAFKLFGDDIEGEFSACQRYYHFRNNVTRIGFTDSFNFFCGSYVGFPVEMRTSPSIVQSAQGVIGRFTRMSSGAVIDGTTSVANTSHGITYMLSSSGLPANNVAYMFDYAANAEL